jgi:hypothetical protein
MMSDPNHALSPLARPRPGRAEGGRGAMSDREFKGANIYEGC